MMPFISRVKRVARTSEEFKPALHDVVNDQRFLGIE